MNPDKLLMFMVFMVSIYYSIYYNIYYKNYYIHAIYFKKLYLIIIYYCACLIIMMIKLIMSYADECQNKYGNANAWKYCCKVFDLLAVAAVSICK